MSLRFLKILLFSILLLWGYDIKGQEVLNDSVAEVVDMKVDVAVRVIKPTTEFYLSMPLLSDAGNINLSIQGQENIAWMRKQLLQNAFFFQKRDKYELQPVFPGLADYRNFGGTLGGLRLNRDWKLFYGAFFCKQYDFQSSTKQMVLGGNLLLQYSFFGKFSFLFEGQFVTQGDGNSPIFKESFLFPSSHVSTGLKYDAGKQSRISVGVEYQYNKLEKRWKPESGGKMLFKF